MIRLLIEHNADVDSQDNRKVSCLMAAFRRVHPYFKSTLVQSSSFEKVCFSLSFYVCQYLGSFQSGEVSCGSRQSVSI